ncbi:MAG: two-component system sensor histidine kinase CpxA [Halioglobus sp.]
MIVRSRFFVRIFLGFWLVTITVLGSWLIAAQYFESRLQTNPSHNPSEAPPRSMQRLIYQLQNRSDEELPGLLDAAKKKHGLDIYLIKNDGEDLYGRKLVLGASEVGRKIQGGNRRAYLETSDGNLFAHSIYRNEQGPLKAVVVFKSEDRGLLSALGQNLWLRVTLAILVSGLVCFALSRAMTNRFKQLQVASRRLAQGNLDTRIQVRDHGGDETDELARDFNSMAEQIERQIQSQKRLLSDVSHELRSPLARLRIALALAERDTQNQDKHLDRIDSEAERLEELIGQLLQSQMSNNTLDLHIDLAVLLQELCSDASFEGSSAGKKVAFISDLEDALVATHSDLLKKTFENILRNALKYTRNNTTVTARLIRFDEDYVVRIEDHGPGVAESELEKLFDEFYREDTARPRETGGYGLGLSIAKRAITSHQGTICAGNTANGLEITVRIPAYIS